MKRKGFTLIELLAVIMILAIVALIATPIVINLIKSAQKGVAERSAEKYFDAVELAIATNNLEYILIEDGVYTVNVDGNLVFGDKILMVEISGDRPVAESTVAIKNGQVIPTGTNIAIGNYLITIDDAGKAHASERIILCTMITPNVQNVWNSAKHAAESKVVGVKATEEAPYALGAVYSCDLGDGFKTFYVLKDKGSNVKLIMNENLGSAVAWASSGDNKQGPVTATAALETRTSKWTKLRQARGTVGLPDGQDIADARGDTSWNDGTWTNIKGADWMRANLNESFSPYGYWTSTAYSVDSTQSWRVYFDGTMHVRKANYAGTGIRPVITISKLNMSL